VENYKYLDVTDSKQRKRIKTQLGVIDDTVPCGLFGILYTNELKVYILNTPGPHWSCCLLVDHNNHRYTLWGSKKSSPLIWEIYKIDASSPDTDEIRKMIHLVCNSASYIKVYNDSTLTITNKDHNKLIIQNIEENIYGIQLY